MTTGYTREPSEGRGTTRTGGEGEGMGALHGRGSSGVWYHGGLECRRTINRPWGLIQDSMRMRLQIYGRVGEGRGRDAEEADKVEIAPGVTV